MKILIGHNHYQWHGGEDAVVKTEAQLLQDSGHEVYLFEAGNEFLQKGPALISHLPDLFWSRPNYQRLRAVLKEFQPDVAHFHNIYFALTPSVYQACADEQVPVVQTLHNFRMVCANALFYRDGKVCEDCVEKSPLEGIIHRCYRGSAAASAAVTAITAFHRQRKTWLTKVNTYITASEFTRQKYIQFGLPSENIFVKPNAFYPDVPYAKPRGQYVLFVGRFSQEKGVEHLLKAWTKLAHIPLKLMGDGPLAPSLKEFARRQGLNQVEFLGHVDSKQYDQYMRGAKFLVIPSQCYENFPRIAVEAFAYGVPVLASRLGSLQEINIDQVTGHCFAPFDAQDLQAKARMMWEKDLSGLSQSVRQTFESKYAPDVNLNQLIEIYRKLQ